MAEFSIDTHYEVRVNVPKSACERIGGWLRALATIIDQRHSLAIRIVTAPKITRRAEIECIESGMKQIMRGVSDSVNFEACEQLLRDNPSVDWNCKHAPR